MSHFIVFLRFFTEKRTDEINIDDISIYNADFLLSGLCPLAVSLDSIRKYLFSENVFACHNKYSLNGPLIV